VLKVSLLILQIEGTGSLRRIARIQMVQDDTDQYFVEKN
jgi:hypothetical protein